MGLLAARLAEKRVLSYQTIWGGDLIGGRINTTAGVAVNQDNALQLSAVWACVRLLTDTVSTLPVATFHRDRGVATPSYPRPGWLDRPSLRDPSITRISYFAQVMTSLLLDGNSFSAITYDDNGDVLEVHCLDPRRVSIARNPDSSPRYTVQLDDGSRNDYGTDEILHIPLIRMPGFMRGLSPIEAARQAIGLSKVAEQFGAEYFANGASPKAIIETPADLTGDQAVELADKFDGRHSAGSSEGRRHRTGVLTNGAKFTPLSITPEQAQFLGLRAWQLTDIARIYRIAPHLIQDVSPGSVSYASVEAQGIEYDTLTVRPYLEIIEVGHQRLLVPGDYLNFDEEGLLRGDLKSRFEAYSSGITAGFMTRNGARLKEDWAPIDGLDQPLEPLYVADAGAATMKIKVGIASQLVEWGWDPAEAMTLSGLKPIKHLGIPPKSLQQAQLLDPADPTSLYLGSGSTPPDAGPPVAKIPPAVATKLAATNGVHP